jgi:DNA-binding transcriptional LysR family regulator
MGLADVELRELRIFLVLADELHFGRTARRLGISQPSVSEAIRMLERRVGARLFDRTSRSVRLTPVGASLRLDLPPAIEALDRALAGAHETASGVSGVLRIATTETTFVPPVVRLTSAFEAAYPACTAQFVEASFASPYAVLRCGLAEVLVNWLALDEPDLTAGPVVASYDRMLAVHRGHRLAGRASVSVEELASEQLPFAEAGIPAAITDAFVPRRTPSGRPIRRTPVSASFTEVTAGVVLGRWVHLTVGGVVQFERDDIVLVPVDDLPALRLGLVWRTAVADARVRALAEVARRVGPWPSASG